MNTNSLKTRLPVFVAVLFFTAAPLLGQNLTATGSSTLITPHIIATSPSDATLTGGGAVVVGSEDGLNLAMDRNEIMARNNGAPGNMFLNLDGGTVFVGAVDSLSALVTNNSGNRNSLWVRGGRDANPAVPNSGAILVGETGGQNLLIDSNEIMARNDGESADLFLNLEGGNIFAGASGSDTVLSAPILSITGGSDFSEMFDVRSETKIEPGMLVVIDEKNPGSLVPSSQVNDCRVAGIISGAGGVKTGMTMGQKGSIADGKYPVALTGRVYCFADASNSAIKPGDMLTTSSTIGHAMKVEDRVSAIGAIIGKAMTGLKQGEKGLVLVLVNLQ